MNKYFTLTLIFIVLSCTSKEAEYWIQKENQDSNLDGFYATPEYCQLLEDICTECVTHKELETQVFITLGAEKNDSTISQTDSLTIKIVEDLEKASEIMVESFGGYCSTGILGLPYRTKDVKLFWTDANLSKLKVGVNEHVNQLQQFTSQDLSNNKITVSSLESNFRDSNAIENLISLRKLQLQLFEINKKIESR